MVTASAGFARIRQTRLRAANGRSGDSTRRNLRRRAQLPRGARIQPCCRRRRLSANPCVRQAIWCGRSATTICSASRAGDAEEPAWFDQKAANVVTGQFQVKPGLVRMLAKDPVTQLMEFMLEPDIDSWEKFSTYMPYLFVRADNRAKSTRRVGRRSCARRTGRRRTIRGSGYRHVLDIRRRRGGRHRRGASTAEAAAGCPRRRRSRRPPGVAWTVRHGKSGFGCRTGWESVDRHRVTTHHLLAVAPSGLPAPWKRLRWQPDWQAVFDEAVSDAERDLIRALADAGVAVPVLGLRDRLG